MNRRQFLIGTTLLSTAAATEFADAQESFPDRPIRVVVPFPPGGTTDVFARLFSERFSQALGVPVVVDNRGGAGGLMGAGEVRRAEPDGYTLIFHSPTSGVTGPLTRRTPPFDPVTGFSHVAILGMTPIVLAVSVQSGVTSLRELVAAAGARSDGLNLATGGVGGGPHLSAELFRARAGGFNMVHVPYRGAGPALQDLISGAVTFMTDTFTPLLPLHREGRIRIISIFDAQRAAVAPDILTAREEGFDVVTRIANYVSAPPNTLPTRLEKLAAAARSVMSHPEMERRLKDLAYVPVTNSNPQHATAFIAEEVAMWRPVIRDAGIALD